MTIPSTLGAVWIAAHFMDMAIYVTNIVTLIGLAIAIDYSMLVVFRYREELEKHDSPQEALVETMKTAGRATLFSGSVVAIGLALLVFMPVPFMQSMGVGGMLVPLFSIAAAATFLPALLAVMGTRVNRFRVIPRRIIENRASGKPGRLEQARPLDHAPPDPLPGRRRRADGRPGASRPRPPPDQRR